MPGNAYEISIPDESGGTPSRTPSPGTRISPEDDTVIRNIKTREKGLGGSLTPLGKRIEIQNAFSSNDLAKRKLNQIHGKTMELRVNPLYERVGNYTKDKERRMYDFWLNIVCFVSLFLAIIGLEIAWLEGDWNDGWDEDQAWDNYGEKKRLFEEVRVYGSPLIWVQLIGTCATLTLFVLRIKLYLFEKKLKESMWDNLYVLNFVYDRREFTKLVLEMLLLAIHPIPGLGPQRYVVCLMFVRCNVSFLLFRDFSEIYQVRKDVIIKVFEKAPNTPFNSFQSLQFELYCNPFRLIAAMVVTLFLMYSYIIHVVERSFQPLEFDIGMSFWYTACVLTGGGAGHEPSTSVGKNFTIFMSLTGIMLETFFVVAVLENLGLSHYQNLALNYMEKRTSERDEANAAASFVQECWRFVSYRHKQENLRKTLKGHNMMDSVKVYHSKLQASQKRQGQKLLEFRHSRRVNQLKANSMGDPTIDRIQNLENRMFREIWKQSIDLDRIKEALGIKEEIEEDHYRGRNFSKLMKDIKTNKEYLLANQPEASYREKRNKIENQEKATRRLSQLETISVAEETAAEGIREESKQETICKESSRVKFAIDEGDSST